jgi:hypothetical protein
MEKKHSARHCFPFDIQSAAFDHLPPSVIWNSSVQEVF